MNKSIKLEIPEGYTYIGVTSDLQTKVELPIDKITEDKEFSVYITSVDYENIIYVVSFKRHKEESV